MTLVNWNDRVLQLLQDIRNNGTPQGSAEGLNLRVLDVNVSNSNPVPVSDGGGSLTVDGAVQISNFPSTQTVDGTVEIGNFPATQPVSGTVQISNFPATQTVDGTVEIGNFPATQTVSGTVQITNLPNQRYSNFEDFGAAASGVAKEGSGVLYSVCLHNHSTTTTRYFQLHNRATAPATGDLATLYFPVSSGNSWIVDAKFFGELGRLFPTGIAWGWSNTPKTFSAVQSPSEHATFINFI